MDNAFIFSNPAIPTSQIELSVPPANITSSAPYFIVLYASPILWVEDAQAVTIDTDSPFKFKSIAIFPAGILAIDIGINIGETLLCPFCIFISHWFWIVVNPPIPELTNTPTFSKSVFSFVILLSKKASLAATIANWELLSNLFACFGSKCSNGLKFLTSAASLVLYVLASINVILSIPHFLFSIPFHVSSTLFPIGVIAPNPVITTLFSIAFSFLKTHYYINIPPSTWITWPVI